MLRVFLWISLDSLIRKRIGMKFQIVIGVKSLSTVSGGD